MQGGALDGGVFLPHSPDLAELLRGAQQAALRAAVTETGEPGGA